MLLKVDYTPLLPCLFPIMKLWNSAELKMDIISKKREKEQIKLLCLLVMTSGFKPTTSSVSGWWMTPDSRLSQSIMGKLSVAPAADEWGAGSEGGDERKTADSSAHPPNADIFNLRQVSLWPWNKTFSLQRTKIRKPDEGCSDSGKKRRADERERELFPCWPSTTHILLVLPL